MARKKKEEVESVEEKKVETTAPKDAEKESKDANKKATEKKPKEKEVIVPEKKTEEKAAKVEVKPIEKATEASKQELTEEQKKAKEEEEKKLKELEAEEKKKKVEALKKAGSIHKQVMEFIKPMIKPGAKVLDICEAAEAKIVELGGMIGFPTNIAINEVAAHYTSPLNDETVINDGDVVKLDIGVAVDGWVADGAITINLNKTDRCKNLVLAVDTAIKAGLQLIKPGVLTKEVGKKTEEIIKQFGYGT